MLLLKAISPAAAAFMWKAFLANHKLYYPLCLLVFFSMAVTILSKEIKHNSMACFSPVSL